MQKNKALTFCLYGDDPIYKVGALENARLAKEIFPDWDCYFFVGSDICHKIKKELSSLNNCHVVECESKPGENPMLWRLLIYNYDFIDVWICRDCDSRISKKEFLSVEEWISSDRVLHVMRDSHNHNYPLMGGMFGLKSSVFKSKYGKSSFLVDLGWDGGDDQSFLANTLWHIVGDDVFCHDHWYFTDPIDPVYSIEGELSWKEAYAVGLVNYITYQRKELYPNYFSENKILRPFPNSEDLKYGVFIGQRIDQNNNPIFDRDVIWEYELRGKYNHK